MSSSQSSGALDRFRDHVMADEALQMTLARCDDPDTFLVAALEMAVGAGIALSADAFGQLRPDPIGLFLHAPAPCQGRSWPGRDWLPIQTVQLPDGGLAMDWVHFAGARLDEPFFALSARRAAERPFNLLFRYRMGLDDFIDAAPDDMKPPDGFIFHMSRCGSTLVSQMLATLPDTIAVSEPAPLDIMVRRAADGGDGARGLLALRAMVAALGQGRSDAGRFVLKLDSWQSMMLPLFRAAFPSVPWVFLYRDPVEVMVSLTLTPSVQFMANVPHHHGIDTQAGASAEEHIAAILELICTAAADRAGDDGLLINHSDLPGAIGSILAHFGIAPGEGEATAMALAALRDAKSPWREHVADSQAKQRAASPAVRAAVERYLAEPYRRLEGLRLARGS
jgi:hypothetical protein